MKTKYVLILLLLITAITITACDNENTTNTPTDNETQKCDLEQGETYCPSTNKCQQVWIEYCEEHKEYYNEPQICTMEYAPVLGDITFPCETGICTTTLKFGNKCVAERSGATNIQPTQELDGIVLPCGDPLECEEGFYSEMTGLDENNCAIFSECAPITQINTENKYDACEKLGGTPLPEHNECEWITQENCEYLEGEFHECESACRNDPEAEMCITLCVPVCTFN